MNALETAKLALRKYLLENKDKVTSDLLEMRNKSKGNDIFRYVEKLSSSYSLSDISKSTEVVYSFPFFELNAESEIEKNIMEYSLCMPPDNKIYVEIEKDSENLSESFFFVNL